VSERVEKIRYTGDTAERLDKYLVGCLPEFSRARLQGLIEDGFVTVNGLLAKKSGQMIEMGAEIELRIPPPGPSGLIPEDIPLVIVYENTDLLVIDKPAGMVVQGHNPEIEGIGGEERPGVVHRLDKETSGLILLAKNERAHRWLQDQFRLRKVEKTYLALVDGKPPTPSGRVEAPVGRDLSHRKKMVVLPKGKGREAISEYRTVETFRDHTLLQVHPLTGRTHQIRLHCAFLGCPIVGDGIYGRKKATLSLGRHFLHAYRLKIILPGEKSPRVFEAPLPEELRRALDGLRSKD
jgi:23S rRNA pseudouridine1911/1915/1917 synthase